MTTQQAGDELTEAKFTFLSTHQYPYLSLQSFLALQSTLGGGTSQLPPAAGSSTRAFQTFSVRVVPFCEFMHRHAASFSNKQCTLQACSKEFTTT
jgi:hypothetical protein